MSNPEFVVFQIPFTSKYKMRMGLIDAILLDWAGYGLSAKHVTVLDVEAVEYVDSGLDKSKYNDVIYRNGEFHVTCAVAGDRSLSDDDQKQEISLCARVLNNMFWWEAPKGDGVESDTVTTSKKGNVYTMTLDLAKVKVRSFSCTSETSVIVPPIQPK